MLVYMNEIFTKITICKKLMKCEQNKTKRGDKLSN